MADVPKLCHERFKPRLTGYKFYPYSKYHKHIELLVKCLCQLIIVPKNQYIPKKCTTKTPGWDKDTLVNTYKNESFYITGYPDENMFITKNISNIVSPHVKYMTRYENKLTVDILLKYFDIFDIIRTADFIFDGENKTIGKITK